MPFELRLHPPATAEVSRLNSDAGLAARAKAVKKALGLIEHNPRHPGLHTHKLQSMTCPHGGDVWQAYAENGRPGAYRIQFCYPPGLTNTIDIIAIGPHE